MGLRRFYCDSINEPTVELPGTESHHLDVLRLGPGDTVELFDGRGGLAQAVISGVKKGSVALQVERVRRIEPRRSRRIVIAASVARGQRFDWLIEKCTELGVDRICPLVFERTVRQPANPKTQKRWINLAISASKQCGRLFLPRIDPPMSLEEVIKAAKDYPSCRVVFGSPLSDSPALAGASFGEADIVALIGPEGGLTDDEVKLLERSGAKPMRLTGTILRTETAAIVFAAITCAWRDADI